MFHLLLKLYQRLSRTQRRRIRAFLGPYRSDPIKVVKTHHRAGFRMLMPQGALIGNLFLVVAAFRWEEEETEIVLQHLSPTDVFLDIGANRGYYTLLAQSRCRRVYAFEPGKQFFRELLANLSLNGGANVTALNYGLFSGAHEAYLKVSRGKLIFPAAPAAKRSDLDAITRRDENFEKIDLRVFDEVREELGIPKVDFLKVDVEGAEIDVLLGMRRTLGEEYPKILLSVHPSKLTTFGRRNDDLFELLQKFAYKFRAISGVEEEVVEPSYTLNYSLFCW